MRSPRGVALLVISTLAGCVVGEGESEILDESQVVTCPLGGPGVYSPYGGAGTYPSGPVAVLPWRGRTLDASQLESYPLGVEDFRGYSSTPTTVECASAKGRRSHLDVTAGCLEAVTTGEGRYLRGLARATSDGYFRAIALGYLPDDSSHPIKWTDQSIEYRFYHRGATGSAGNPGFKAFARYRDENNLYVASWRFDGVVQIQRKRCGEYVTLAMRRDRPPPTAGAWHWLRFDAVGSQLRLSLDDELALTASSGTFSWGSAGIRIDSADGTYVDDWSVLSPDS
jgi:hypothetical protein